jgi:hypothetical protein
MHGIVSYDTHGRCKRKSSPQSQLVIITDDEKAGWGPQNLFRSFVRVGKVVLTHATKTPVGLGRIHVHSAEEPISLIPSLREAKDESHVQRIHTFEPVEIIRPVPLTRASHTLTRTRIEHFQVHFGRTI